MVLAFGLFLSLLCTIGTHFFISLGYLCHFCYVQFLFVKPELLTEISFLISCYHVQCQLMAHPFDVGNKYQ